MSVVVEKLVIRYGTLVAVDDISATFLPGTTGLLGVNGAGKSSLIKGLLGLVDIHSGSASILGMDVKAEGKNIRQQIGYMPEDDSLIPGLSGLRLVQFAGELAGMSRQDAMQRAHEILFWVGLEEARYRRVETYSSGMKQRIKLAQAIVHDPKIVFLDEPTSGMDPKGRQEMLDLIQAVAQSGKMSIVLASHILTDVERICDRVVMLHEGRVLEQGSMDDFRGQYARVYSIRVDGERQPFVEKLKKAGCEVNEDGSHLMDITLPAGKDTTLFLKTADAADVQLRRMIPSVQTLEDIFVKRIGEASSADL